MRTYNIQFEGYWLERNKSDVPAKSGVYMVYRGKYNQENNSVDLFEIIYIGQSINMRERITNHDHIQAFEATLNYGETLCYSGDKGQVPVTGYLSPRLPESLNQPSANACKSL